MTAGTCSVPMIRVLSYNIHFGKRLSRILSWLSGEFAKSDVICLQEYPQSKLTHLEQSLPPHFRHLFAHAFTIGKSTYGQVTIYNSSVLDLKSSSTLELGISVLESAFNLNRRPRTALVTRFQSEGRDFVLAHTHLVCAARNKLRRKQLSLILDYVKSTDHTPTMILGDLNYTSVIKQGPLLRLMAQHDYKSAYRAITHRMFFLKHQVDYAFYKYCSVDQVYIGEQRLSDHYPIHFAVHIP